MSGGGRRLGSKVKHMYIEERGTAVATRRLVQRAFLTTHKSKSMKYVIIGYKSHGDKAEDRRRGRQKAIRDAS